MPEFAVPKSRFYLRARRAATRLAMWSAVGAAVLPLDGCAVAALPCRLTSATLKILPVVGHVAATPFDACAAAID
ncbi:Putative lipoprotein [Paraburkholderia caribensis]|nr:Putative lipoprotein [Paraburkholderia caribensis]